MQGVKDQHLVLAREMNALVDAVRSLGTEAHGRVTAASGRENAA